MGEEIRSRKKCLTYVAIFIVFQIIVITTFALTVMKVKSPKVRFNDIAVQSFSSTSNSSTSVNMKLLGQVTVKNSNFGHFKYEESKVVILYNGVPLGESVIPQGRASAKKTKRFQIEVDVSTATTRGNSELLRDINSGKLKLSSQATLQGKVELMKIIKKKKSGEMACDWDVNLANRQIENLNCA